MEAAKGGLVTYPDVIVICGEPQFLRPKRLVVLNPVLVVEGSQTAERARAKRGRGRKGEVMGPPSYSSLDTGRE